MNDSENKKNDINEKPITTIRRGIEDIESSIFGGILGVIMLVAGIFTLFKAPMMGLILIAASIFPLCETVRGMISVNNKSLINKYNKEPSEEIKQQMNINDNKLRIISKIKIIGVILTVITIILAVVLGK